MKKKILIVDDNPQIVRLLAMRLKASNFDVVAAYDGYQCIPVAKKESPDLILLDIKMPLGGGIGAYETLKGMADTSIIPVIFITAEPSTEVKNLVMEMGADGFVAKPFDSEDLLEKINTALSGNNVPSDDSLFTDSVYIQN
jgi:DNA-binding response OmpR family regulator